MVADTQAGRHEAAAPVQAALAIELLCPIDLGRFVVICLTVDIDSSFKVGVDFHEERRPRSA